MSISIIIPTLNESAGIADAVQRAQALGGLEVIVVDGGSTDGTVDLARDATRVLTTDPGRARQQNAGAAVATGDVLLFLHADCWLEPGSLNEIAAALADPAYVGGCFGQQIEAIGRKYRWLEWGNALRVRRWTLAYGDQAIFVRKSVFEELGGFPDLKLMEDLFFMRTLRRRGRFALLPPLLHVSARRWRQHGVIRQTARNWLLTLAAHWGVSPNTLARFYPPAR
ncbi:MAG: TIGR04283 family arsenosugar biosynthesis glycosyltransferase [Planctomycetota bacterium]|nr:TIGR04283 family arsenosugar biosynthesis glycosyltransferase [Planctomycetota bacterium]